ncbi:MAG: phospholipase D family protein [Candidatus Omnitrophica bacterium]|nr:phospholipase D family protein [Candidatus Omnitrophota bacterium]
MKINKVSIIIALSFLAISCSHANLRENANSGLFSQIEDMHLSEEIRYPDSPFDDLVKDAFRNHHHYVNMLNIGDDALLAIVHLIRQARKSINIQTFIWGNDEAAGFVAYELFKAAKRGVIINIIIDGFGNKKDPKTDAILAAANQNLRVKYYNPVAKNAKHSKLQLVGNLIVDFKKINQRMHNKVLIIDDRIAITGGRNYQNAYFDRGQRSNYKDRDCLVIGPVVKKMTDSFMDYWAFKWSILSCDLREEKNEIKEGGENRLNAEESFELGNIFNELDKQASDYEHIKNVFIKRAYLVDSIEFIADGPGKTKNSQAFRSSSVAEELSQLITKTQKSIIIQTPYLVLPKNGVKVFEKLRRKHPEVDIRISSNSLSATDHFIAYALSYQNKKKYLKKLRWRIFEFKHDPVDVNLIAPPVNLVEREKDYFTCIHAKTYVVDKEKLFIGSFNVDPRSINLNTEAGLLIYDKKVAQDVAGDILRDMAPQNSWTIGKRKKIPVISHFSGVFEEILKIIPIVDIWPYNYSTSFKLVAGKEELPFYHPDFYQHYNDVGSFPDVAGTPKEIETRLFKAFFGKVTEPLI